MLDCVFIPDLITSSTPSTLELSIFASVTTLAGGESKRITSYRFLRDSKICDRIGQAKISGEFGKVFCFQNQYWFKIGY